MCVCVFVDLLAQDQTTEHRTVEITEIKIVGNKKTKPQIIERELSVKVGQKYYFSEIDSIFEWERNRIYNTNLFNSVTISLCDTSLSSTCVKIIVHERWYFYPLPVFKLVDRNFNDWWVNRNKDLSRVNYGVKFFHYNVRGKAERTKIELQFGFERRVLFLYSFPYVDKKQKFGLSFFTFYTVSNNLPVFTENNVRRFIQSEVQTRSLSIHGTSISYRNSFNSYHRLGLNYSQIHVNDTILQLNPNYFNNSRNQQRNFSLTYEYSWNKRNNDNYPTNGEWYVVYLSKTGLGFFGDVNLWKLKLSFSKYLDIKKGFYFTTNTTTVLSTKNNHGFFNYNLLGVGRNVIRGHEHKVVEGNNFVLNKNDFRKKLFSHTYDLNRFAPVEQVSIFPINIYGKIFFDHGYVRGYQEYDGSSLLDDQYIYSFGIGLDFVLIYDRVIRLEYSRNKLNETNFFINAHSTF